MEDFKASTISGPISLEDTKESTLKEKKKINKAKTMNAKKNN